MIQGIRAQASVLEFGVVLVELALIGIVVHKAWQLRRNYRERAATGSDMYDSLRESARAALGSFAGGVLAYELAVLYYAVAGWTKSAPADDESFSAYRSTGYTALMNAAMIAVVAETAGVHLLVRLWSPTIAWVLTGLSIYAAVWIIGDYHALRLRPVRVSDGTLHFRLGLRWAMSVPVASIARVDLPAGEAPARKEDYLKAVLIGAPNRRLELTEPVRANGFYGLSRRVKTLELHVDEPARFDAALDRGEQRS